MVTNVDRNVGRLFKKLDSLGLTDNTIVIFMVDNGPNGQRYVAGMKGHKSMVHEGGIRSPFFIHWPAVLRSPSEVTGPYAHIDVMPTLVEACGASLPNDRKIDGISFLGDLKGERNAAVNDRAIVIQSHRGNRPVRYHNFMIRHGEWKLLHGSGFGRESFEGAPQFELYNLHSDPLEMKNVVDSHPDVTQKLKGEYDRWFDDVGNTRVDNYAPPRIHVGTEHENPTTLTRQDWRHLSGKPWARNSIGNWLLNVEKAGNYDVVCRFSADDSPETIKLIANDFTQTREIEKDAETIIFQGVPLAAGELTLSVEISDGRRTRGIHQADVELR